MRVAVLGSGLMGKEAARDLVHSPGVKKVGLADIDLKRAEAVCKSLSSGKISAHVVDAGNTNELAAFLKDYDVVINALFYSFNEIVARTAIDVGVHSVDLGGHIGHITDKVLELDERAKEEGVTIIPDLGVAPGMINILSGFGAGKLNHLSSIRLFVGGIPVRPEPRLNIIMSSPWKVCSIIIRILLQSFVVENLRRWNPLQKWKKSISQSSGRWKLSIRRAGLRRC